MKNLVIFKLILFVLLPLMAFAGNGKVLEASKSVIRIITIFDDGSGVTGTAFSINDEGYFLTNAHVVDGAKSVVAVMSSDKYDVEVIKKYDDIDLAILKIKNTGLKPLTFAYKKNIHVTDRVSSIGFPSAADKNDDIDELTTVTINSGIIGKLTKINLSIDSKDITTRYPVVQHDAAVNHGNSGGPLVNECGQVVGINVQKGLSYNRSDAQIIVGDVVQGIFYAIDVDIANRVLNEMHISFLETGSECTLGGTSMTVNDRKYLIIGGILLLLLVIWAVIFYLQEKKGKPDIDESELSRLVSRKLGEKSDKNVANGVIIQLKPMKSGFPVFVVGSAEKVVGRSRSVALHLENPLVSGKHLSLSLNSNDEVVVKDLNSSNGTYIEGRKLTPNIPTVLKRGERLVIGSEDVIYMLG